MEAQHKFNEEEDGGSLKCQNSITSPSDDSKNGSFECNICLDSVQDPVLTLCGHLYCWPCIYSWINRDGNGDNQESQCPVCKAIVHEKNVIPLYGRDQSTNSSSDGKVSSIGLVVPRRPQTPLCHETFSPMLGHSRSETGHTRDTRLVPIRDSRSHMRQLPMHAENVHPGYGMLGGRVYSMMYGDSFYYNYGGSDLRFQRQMKKVDISLSRLCFFMFCCMILCLLLF